MEFGGYEISEGHLDALVDLGQSRNVIILKLMQLDAYRSRTLAALDHQVAICSIMFLSKSQQSQQLPATHSFNHILTLTTHQHAPHMRIYKTFTQGI